MFGVIFDMDGVLVDSYRAHFVSWQRMAADFGLAMTEPQFRATFGRTSRDIIRQLWGEGAIPDDQIHAADESKEAYYRELIAADFPEMPGAGQLLQALHDAGFRMAIGSSGPPENVAAVIQRLPHGRYIEAAISGREVTRGKPDPQVFLLAAAKLRLSPADCAVIEDAPAGVDAAVRAGMTAIAITGTASREQLAHARLVVDSLTELSPTEIASLIAGRK